MVKFNTKIMKNWLLLCLLSVALSTNAQYTMVPDTVFEKNLIMHGWDTWPLDGKVLTASIDTVVSLEIFNFSNLDMITDFTGIAGFGSLKYFKCSDVLASSLNLSSNTELIKLDVQYNLSLSNVNLNGLHNLKEVYLQYNPSLTSINLTTDTAIQILWIDENSITTVDLSQNKSLKSLKCRRNDLTSLDVSSNHKLTYLDCSLNQLTSLNLIGASLMETLMVYENQLTSLNLSHMSHLSLMGCRNNLLQCLNLRNGNNYNLTMVAYYNPPLYCIEVDDSVWSSAYWSSNIDPFAHFSEDCNNSCSGTSGVNEHDGNSVKKIISITDILGRPGITARNRLLIIRYSDGTVEKRIVIE